MSEQTREEVDAKITASEAHTIAAVAASMNGVETQMAVLVEKFTTYEARTDKLETHLENSDRERRTEFRWLVAMIFALGLLVMRLAFQ